MEVLRHTTLQTDYEGYHSMESCMICELEANSGLILPGRRHMERLGECLDAGARGKSLVISSRALPALKNIDFAFLEANRSSE